MHSFVAYYFELNILNLCYFDAGQAFVRKKIEEGVLMLLPGVCGNLSAKVARLNHTVVTD